LSRTAAALSRRARAAPPLRIDAGAGTNCFMALIANPAGVCIQLFTAMIHVAEMSAPSATMQWRRNVGLCRLLMLNSMTPEEACF
jgi:hypothetical protein